jgi:hypothetical protein
MAYCVRGQRLANPNKQEMDRASRAFDHIDIRNVCAPLLVEEKVKPHEPQANDPKGTAIHPESVRR